MKECLIHVRPSKLPTLSGFEYFAAIFTTGKMKIFDFLKTND